MSCCFFGRFCSVTEIPSITFDSSVVSRLRCVKCQFNIFQTGFIFSGICNRCFICILSSYGNFFCFSFVSGFVVSNSFQFMSTVCNICTVPTARHSACDCTYKLAVTVELDFINAYVIGSIYC